MPIEVGPKCDTKLEELEETNLNSSQKFIRNVIHVIVSVVLIFTVISVILNKCHFKSCLPKSVKHLKSFADSLSIISNSCKLFEPRPNRLTFNDSLLSIFIFWIFVGRIYIAPLTMNLVGVKALTHSLVL